jgi:hypothetical protein
LRKNINIIYINEKKELTKIISSNTIDYLVGKVKEHNIGIKIEKKYPNGVSESLSV